MCTVTDASFCNESIYEDGQKVDGRSQQGFVLCVAPADIANRPEAPIHPIAWSSTVIRRVCRSTLMAETFSMIRGTECGARLRAAIVDMKGKLDLRNWEASACKTMGHVWMTDCDSLYEHLISPKFNNIENKRLGIDLMALRQQIWEKEDGDRSMVRDGSSGDYPKWIDTSVMLADCLTKAMDPERLVQTLQTGIFDMRPTALSLMIKEKNRQSRKATKLAAKSATDDI